MGGRLALVPPVAVGLVLAIAIWQTSAPANPPSASAKFVLTSVAAALPVTWDAAPQTPSGRVESRTFWSASLERAMPYRIFLPPGYERSSRAYPTLYLLHGMGGSDRQWQDMGVAAAADRLIAAGKIAPLIIVMPEGERAYWVDHASGGQKWGRYTAVDVVSEVEANFRSIPRRQSRAIGGLSMGAHGALQLALNYPGEFAAVGAHSLVLRRFGNAPAFFGTATDFAKRDPTQLVQARGREGCSFAIWIDIGEADPWAPVARQFDGELTELGIRHQWHLWAGDHSPAYWSAHLEDYLRFYDASLKRDIPRSSLS